MHISANRSRQAVSGNSVRPLVDAMFVDECVRDELKILIPRPELHLAVRVGPAAINGLDIHVIGARQRVARKTVRQGQRTILARLALGDAVAVLGAPPSAFAGHVVPIEAVWGAADARKLYDDLATATETTDAAMILERAISARLSRNRMQSAHASLVREAAKKLLEANVRDVAAHLRISERHLRRVFLETVGMSPKTFARLMRFSHAMDLARDSNHASWTDIAVASGYYDQAHLIEDFHAFAGTTPEAFRREFSKTGAFVAAFPCPFGTLHGNLPGATRL